MNFISQAQLLLPKLIEWRRELHRNPELSFQEYKTQSFICEILDRYEIPYRKIATTGILASLGDPEAKSPLILRADMDALPINETVDIEFASTNGAMHACGHDMHTVMLLGALILLKNSNSFHGNLLGLFQPGEETHPGGASLVLGEGVFDHIEPRAFLGQHVSPELEVGTFGFRAGQFMASTDEIHITVHGHGGHGAMPHLLQDPVVASAAIILAMQTIVSRNNSALTPSVLSFGRIIADGATNVIPNDVYIEGTFRTMDEVWRAQAKELIHRVATSTAEAYGAIADVDIRDGYPSVFNDELLTANALMIAQQEFGTESVIEIPKRMTAEDFGFYSARYPALFFRTGVGASAPLHNSKFCPDERSLAYGAAMMATLASRM